MQAASASAEAREQNSPRYEPAEEVEAARETAIAIGAAIQASTSLANPPERPVGQGDGRRLARRTCTQVGETTWRAGGGAG